MREKGMVTAITGSEITVIPLITDACLSCTAGCAKRGKPFIVTNPKAFPLTTGSIVQVGSSKRAQAFQGVIALLFPFASAIAGYCCATPIAALFGKTAGEGSHAIGVLLCLFLSAALVYFISRKVPFPGKPEITEML